MYCNGPKKINFWKTNTVVYGVQGLSKESFSKLFAPKIQDLTIICNFWEVICLVSNGQPSPTRPEALPSSHFTISPPSPELPLYPKSPQIHPKHWNKKGRILLSLVVEKVTHVHYLLQCCIMYEESWKKVLGGRIKLKQSVGNYSEGLR